MEQQAEPLTPSDQYLITYFKEMNIPWMNPISEALDKHISNNDIIR